MAIYALADLHFPGGQDKPMNVFGNQWDDHVSKVIRNWNDTVHADDLVLVPGDLSWAMHFEQAHADLKLIADLPGEKLILRGNHDYWWSSIAKIRQWLPSSMHALQNDAFVWKDIAIAGARGWTFPTEFSPLNEQDLKIYHRELIRLELSLQQASKYQLPILAMMHYPPLLKDTGRTAFTDLLEQYQVMLCCYGHLHHTGIANAYHGNFHDIPYHLVSCDAIDFTPKLIHA